MAKIEFRAVKRSDKNNDSYYVGRCNVPATLDMKEAIFFAFPHYAEGENEQEHLIIVVQQAKDSRE